MSKNSIRQRSAHRSKNTECESLTITDLVKQLSNVKHKWYKIGRALNTPEAELKSLAVDDEVRLRLVIEQVEPKGEHINDDKLMKITQALRDESVNEDKEADKIEGLFKKKAKINGKVALYTRYYVLIQPLNISTLIKCCLDSYCNIAL